MGSQLLRGETLAAFIVVASTFSPGANVHAQPSQTWMREYVRLRVAQRNVAALLQSGDISRLRSDLKAFMTPRIVGGSIASASDNPFQVALLQANNENNRQAQFCGGTLIRDRFVVTAAHCSDFIAANDVQVLTGARRLDGSGIRRNVRRIAIHPQWDPKSFNNDVAIWELDTATTGQALATLATADNTVNTLLLATGWGAIGEGQAGSIDLRRVELPLVDRGNCNDGDSYNGQITNQMLCAGRDRGGIDTCQGDSGGPLAIGSVLNGITSWGEGCARPNLFGVYTRISDPAIRSFIENTVR